MPKEQCHSDDDKEEDSTEIADTRDDVNVSVQDPLPSTVYERRTAFVLPTDPDSRCEVFTANRTFSVPGHVRETDGRRETVTQSL